MDLKQMRYFTQACNDSNFSVAAKHLFVTQQALSNVIKNIESEFDTRLFIRNSRGVELTDAGKFLYERTDKFLEHYDTLACELNDKFKLARGTISFCVAPGVLRSLSPNILIDFEEKYPKIKIIKSEFPDLMVEYQVSKEKVGIGCSIRPFDLSGLDFMPIKYENLFLIVNKNNSLSKRKKVSIKELAGENFIMFDKNFQLRHLLARYCQNEGFIPKVIFESAEVDVLTKLVYLNKGIFICVRHVADEIKNKNVCAVPLSDKTLKWEIGFLHKKNVRLSPELKTFTNYVLSNIHT